MPAPAGFYDYLISLATRIAGERNPSSATGSYLDTRGVTSPVILETEAVAHAVGGSAAANDIHLRGVQIHTALTGTLTITGFEDEDGDAKSYVIPAGAVGWQEFAWGLNTKGALTMTLSSVADNSLCAVFYRAA